jgi:hypothetical protein
MLKKVPTDQRAAEREERLLDFLQLLVPDSQSSKAVQPGPGALHDPAVAPQPLARVDPPPRDAGLDASAAKLRAQRARVIGLVCMQLRGAPPRSTLHPTYRLNGVNAAQHHPGIMRVGSALHDRERYPFGVDHQMALRARFPAIRRIRAGLRPPFGAGTVKGSTDARLQSSWSASVRRASRTRCSWCQTPACCHSRSLRQQVAPEPQPISWGNQDQGSPVRRTKMMPRSTSRLARRGRPPLGLAGAGGSRGSTTAQSSSLTVGLAIMSDSTKDQPQLPKF